MSEFRVEPGRIAYLGRLHIHANPDQPLSHATELGPPATGTVMRICESRSPGRRFRRS
jgi:hypothetical protein